MFRSVIIYTIVFFSCSWLLYHYVPKPQGHYDADSWGYELIAHSIQQGDIADPRVGDVAIQPLGYPLFLALFFRLGAYLPTIILIQVILAWLTGLLLYAISFHLFCSSVAAITLALYATCLGPYIYAQLLLAETVAVFLLMAFIWLFLRFLNCCLMSVRPELVEGYERSISFDKLRTNGSDELSAGPCILSKRKRIEEVTSAIPLGLSLIFKPTALLLPFCLFPLLIMRTKWHTILFFFIISFTPMLLHMSLNYHRFGYFQFAPLRSLNIYQVFASKVIARVEGISLYQATEQLQFTGINRFDESGWEKARTLFWHYATYYPGTMLCVWLQNMIKTLGGLYVTQLKGMLGTIKGGDHSFFVQKGSFLKRMTAYVAGGTHIRTVQLLGWYEVVWSLIRYFFFIIGCIILFWRKQYALLFFCTVYIAVCSIITGFDGCVRYRLPFEPILIMVAAVGIFCTVDWLTLCLRAKYKRS